MLLLLPENLLSVLLHGYESPSHAPFIHQMMETSCSLPKIQSHTGITFPRQVLLIHWPTSSALSPQPLCPPYPVAMHHKEILGEAQGAAHLPRSLKHLLIFAIKFSRQPLLCQNPKSSSLLWIGRTWAKSSGLLLIDLQLPFTSLLRRGYGVGKQHGYIPNVEAVSNIGSADFISLYYIFTVK